MELTVSIKLDNNKRGEYSEDKRASQEWTISVPEGPGDHETEIQLVEAISSLVRFGDAIGRLCEVLAAREGAEGSDQSMGVQAQEQGQA